MAGHDGCTPSAVKQLCQRYGFELSLPQAEQLSGYLSLLMHWNRAMNLVGARYWRDALENLVLDSCYLDRFLREQVLPSLPETPVSWDLGSGAGLPGIPLRILWAAGEYTMVDSREKRTLFLSTVLARMPLSGTRVCRDRVEHFMEGKKADLIVSRAFMPWRELLALVRGHLNPGGKIVFLTLEPLHPDRDMPWLESGTSSYRVGNDERFFCAFSASV